MAFPSVREQRLGPFTHAVVRLRLRHFNGRQPHSTLHFTHSNMGACCFDKKERKLGKLNGWRKVSFVIFIILCLDLKEQMFCGLLKLFLALNAIGYIYIYFNILHTHCFFIHIVYLYAL